MADNTILKILFIDISRDKVFTGPMMMTSYDEIAELATQPAEQQNAEEQHFNHAAVARPSRQQAEAAVELLLRWAGDDPAREGLVDTPARVVRSYENFSPAIMTTPKKCLPAPLKRLRDMMIW